MVTPAAYLNLSSTSQASLGLSPEQQLIEQLKALKSDLNKLEGAILDGSMTLAQALTEAQKIESIAQNINFNCLPMTSPGFRACLAAVDSIIGMGSPSLGDVIKNDWTDNGPDKNAIGQAINHMKELVITAENAS